MSAASWKLPKFPREIEERFRIEHAQLTRRVVRVSLPVAMVTYLAFFFWDLVQPNANVDASFMIRFAAVLMGAAGLLFSFSRAFLHWAQEVVFGMVTTAAAGVAVILYMFNDGFIVGVAGVCLVIMFGCSLGTLRFWYATAFAVSTIAICNVLIVFGHSSYERSYVLINSNFFLVGFSLFSIVFSYVLELEMRQRFRDTGTMVRWTQPSARKGGPPPKRVFVCYRRAGTADVTGRIQDQLGTVFGNETFVRDVEVVPLGADFRPFLGQLIRQCALVLAVVGQDWEGDGTHSTRISDEEDPVRTEIELAMNLNIPIIPVLVQGVQMPHPEQLPETIRGFAYRNAAVVRPDPDFHADIDRLVHQLTEALEG